MIIGIDIGNVICRADTDCDGTPSASAIEKLSESRFVDGSRQIRAPLDDGVVWEEVPDAFEAVRLLSNRCARATHDSRVSAAVWLISKCFENQQKRTRRWLEKTRFYERTGVHPARVLFCTECEHKAVIGAGLGLTHFVDDRVDCLAPFGDGTRLYLFGEDEARVYQLRREGANYLPLRSWRDVIEHGELP